MYWHIYDVPGAGHVRIPIPFEVGIMFGAIPPAIAETYKGDRDKKDLAKFVGKAVGDVFALNPFNAAILKPFVQQTANKDHFTEAPIVSESEKRLLPEAQVGLRTSKISQELGKITGRLPKGARISPKRLDKFAQDALGWIAPFSTQIIDTVLEQAIEYPEDPATRVGDRYVSGIGRFVKGNDVKTFTKWNEKFYDYLADIEQLQNTANHYRKLRLKGEFKELRKKQRSKLRQSKYMKRQQKMISKINAKIKLIHLSTKLSGEEKRQKIDDLLIKRRDRMRRAVERVDKRLEG
jgi:hypothetical protein